jgi:hypothetical protein
VAANLGYCGLDRRRQPLAGDELRGCWQEGVELQEPGPGDAGRLPARPDPLPGVARLEFVEVVTSRRPAAGRGRGRASRDPQPSPAEPPLDAPAVSPPPSDETRWSLWGEPER